MSSPRERVAEALRPPRAADGLNRDSTLALRSGDAMPVMGLGSWMLTSHTEDAVRRAIELGYRMIDTSGDYHTQRGIGRAIRASEVAPDELFIVTKVEPEKDSYASTVANLAELGLAYVDLVLIHRAPDKGVGESQWRGLMRARDEGLARNIGVSSYRIEQLQALEQQTGEMPAVQQIEWSPFGHSYDMLNFCEANDIVLQAYSPLTRGKRLRDARLLEIAREQGRSAAQVILRWDLQHGVAPIPKAYREDHQRENIDVFDFELDTREMADLDALNERYSALDKLEYL
jgi:2,5-diketo-D-gluconate reductase A